MIQWLRNKLVTDETNSTPIGKLSSTNAHVVQFLDYYLSLKRSPSYAVLVNGPWGVGKTYLVKQYMRARYDGKRHLYVSLYGLSSTDQINDALLQALLPFIGWKTTKIVGRLSVTALKYAGIESDLKLSDVLTKFEDKVLIVDDLERATFPVDQILGHINTFVEHDGCRVIILCNEDEIRPTKLDEYARRKEKLVGKTLTVHSALDEALTAFISDVDDDRARRFLVKSSSEIQSLYRQGGRENLRILQQSIWDFARFYVSLSDKHATSDAACLLLLRLLLTLSFEVKAGTIAENDLIGRHNASLMYAFEKKGADADAIEPPFVVASRRYAEIDLENSILSDEILIDILFKGVVDKDGIGASIDLCPLFVLPENEPAWRAVWHGFDRTDVEFEERVSEMERQFDGRELKVCGEMLHVFGLRLWLSELGILAANREAATQQCKRYIDDLSDKNELEPMQLNQMSGHDSWNTGYGGPGFQSRDLPEFKVLLEYLNARRVERRASLFPSMVADLLVEMENDPELYFRRICPTNSDDNIYFRVPILAYVEPEEFVRRFRGLTPFAQRTVFAAFKGRYELGDLDGRLSQEKPWLEDIRDRIQAIAEESRPLSKFRLRKLLEWNVLPFVPQT